MTGETVTIWAGKHGPYLVTRDKKGIVLLEESIDLIEEAEKVQAKFARAISWLLRDLVGEYDPEDRDALIDAIISRFGSKSVSAYA